MIGLWDFCSHSNSQASSIARLVMLEIIGPLAAKRKGFGLRTLNRVLSILLAISTQSYFLRYFDPPPMPRIRIRNVERPLESDRSQPFYASSIFNFKL